MQKILAIKNKKDYNLSQVERENVQRVSQMWQVKIKSYEDLKNDIDYKTICGSLNFFL